MKLSSVLLLIQCAASLVIIDSKLATQCIYYMKSYDWGCNSTSNGAKAYKCRCYNIDWIGSITNCFESQGINDTRGYIDHAYRHVRSRCINKGRIDYPVDVLKQLQKNATQYLVEAGPYNKKHQTFTPLQVNETEFEFSKGSINHIYAHVIRSQAYQWGYIFFWTFVILVGFITNICRHFIFKYINHNRSKFTSNTINRIRFHLTQGNLLHKSFYKILWFFPIQFPSKTEGIVLFFFIIYMILQSCTGYTIQLPNIYMNTRYYQLMDLIGYRTALGSFALMPPTFFFGIRNNPFIKLTNSSISTYMFYHKWSAIGMSIQGLIHSAVWTGYTITEGDYSAWAMDAYWKWGIGGTTILFVMMFFAFYPFRKLAYEVFLFFHQAFGVMFIVSMWYHCYTLGWMGWVYACIVIWVYDRGLRFFSILWNGGARMAKITRLNEDLVRIVVTKPPESHDYYIPGGYYYIYFLNLKLRFFQSHPFSIMKSKRHNEMNCYSMVFKSHKGITKKIHSYLADKAKNTSIVEVLTEGPYGHRIPLKTHEQYVFIGAGVGFTPLYSQAVDIVERNLIKKDGFKQQVTFIWVVRTYDYYKLFEEDMEFLFNNDVQVKVYIVGEEGKNIEEDNLQINFLGKRPNLKCLVTENDLKYSTTFVSSGPSSFTDGISEAVGEVIKDSTVRIDYHSESFIM